MPAACNTGRGGDLLSSSSGSSLIRRGAFPRTKRFARKRTIVAQRDNYLRQIITYNCYVGGGGNVFLRATITRGDARILSFCPRSRNINETESAFSSLPPRDLAQCDIPISTHGSTRELSNRKILIIIVGCVHRRSCACSPDDTMTKLNNTVRSHHAINYRVRREEERARSENCPRGNSASRATV